MKSSVSDRLLARTPEDVKQYSSWYSLLLIRVNQILEDKGYLQDNRVINDSDKLSNEIGKWIRYEFDFSLRSLAKLQVELGERILEIPLMPEIKESTVNVSFGMESSTAAAPSKASVVGYMDWNGAALNNKIIKNA